MAFLSTHIKLADLPAGEKRGVEVARKAIGLYHTAEGLFALDDLCPHRDAPLHKGFVRDGQIVCPWHQWHFQLKDGQCTNIPGAKVKSYKVEVRDGMIYVSL